MCGIAGYLGLNDESLLRAMAAKLAHRGPDGEGIWYDEEAMVGLAHRRLAILDPTAAARQPMASCGNRYQVIFNGEIYNFRALGVELRKHGYDFNPNSDTAVIGPLYDLLGTNMLSRLNGIFAFGLWDRENRELLIARDAFGVKPLYYTRAGPGILFASELKALASFRGLDRTINIKAISDYLVHLWSPGEQTAFRSVSKLPPGYMLRASLDNVELSQWYQPNAVQPLVTPPDDLKALTGKLGRIFDRAVAGQCISDVPVGAFLSGGIDSSAVVASMVASGHRPRRAYCIGFRDDRWADEGFSDDLRYARQVAEALDVSLTPIFVEQPQASDLENLAYMLDEPQADPAPLYVAAIAQAAREDGIKVLLSGAGGDDIFSGYRRHRAAALRANTYCLYKMLPKLSVNRFMAMGSKPLRRRLDKLQYMFAGTDNQFLMRAFEFNQREIALDCLSTEARALLANSEESWLEQAILQSEGRPLVERMLDLEMHGFLPDHNLNYTDKAAMSHGVEVRVPFLDNQLVSFARRVPWQLKTRGFNEKWILKQAFVSRLPSAVLNRKKAGFGAPVRHWICGPMRAMIEDIFASRSFRERGLFDVAATSVVLADTLSGRRDGAYLILALVMVEFWMRRFADGPGPDAPALRL